ncbi:MAG: sodium:proton antiporter [Bacteroidales bacterium]|nr:sodium:proton antiporter [Candidatus Cacconaster equi]
MNESGPRRPSWYVSLIPFLVLIAVLVVVIRLFGSAAMDGGSQVALLFSAGVAVAIAVIFYKAKWKDLEKAIGENIHAIGSAIIILLLIGAVAGSWMASGVVPTLICYGMKVMTPRLFLFSTCIICAVVSLMTGSSWTTIATIGVALLGIGTAQGYSAGWTAGAIISGAYFGDKISPLSDTTVLASSSAGTPLFTHIRYMLVTTVPSISIALIIFLCVSLSHDVADAGRMNQVCDALESSFNISPWLLIVPVVTGVLIARKVPALPTLFLSSLTAGICSLIAQPEIIWSIAHGGAAGSAYTDLSFADGFKGMFISFYNGTAVDTGNVMVNELVATRGMTGILPTIFLIVSAATFGGVLVGSGMIQSLTEALTRRIKSRTGLVSSTVLTGVASNMMTGDQFLSIILTCSLYGKLYDKMGFEGRLLSRSTEDSATVTSVLIPWNSCGMTQSTVLKVPTLDYLPYCFFNLISPLMSIFIAAIGYKIFRKEVSAG